MFSTQQPRQFLNTAMSDLLLMVVGSGDTFLYCVDKPLNAQEQACLSKNDLPLSYQVADWLAEMCV